jgi:hypothetical protein
LWAPWRCCWARVVATDLPDRLRLLRKNLQENLGPGNWDARVAELVSGVWGDDDDPDPELLHP